jgi:hypothetical protein
MEKGTQDMADDNAFAAAQLAAALIQAGKLTEKAHGNTVQDATLLYFECLDAVRAESKKRSAPSAPTPPPLKYHTSGLLTAPAPVVSRRHDLRRY